MSLLSNRDIKYMEQKAIKASSLITAEVRYKRYVERNSEENNEEEPEQYGYGYDNKEEEKLEWTEWEEYDCSIEDIDEYNIDDYPFGDMEEGDLLIIFPKNTSLEPNAEEYEIKIGDDTYVAETSLKKLGFVGNTFMYYGLVGGLA